MLTGLPPVEFGSQVLSNPTVAGVGALVMSQAWSVPWVAVMSLRELLRRDLVDRDRVLLVPDVLRGADVVGEAAVERGARPEVGAERQPHVVVDLAGRVGLLVGDGHVPVHDLRVVVRPSAARLQRSERDGASAGHLLGLGGDEVVADLVGRPKDRVVGLDLEVVGAVGVGPCGDQHAVGDEVELVPVLPEVPVGVERVGADELPVRVGEHRCDVPITALEPEAEAAVGLGVGPDVRRCRPGQCQCGRQRDHDND